MDTKSGVESGESKQGQPDEHIRDGPADGWLGEELFELIVVHINKR